MAIIEPDEAFATELRDAVESAGFRTDCFKDAASALSDVRREAFALAIVDLGMRDADPYDVCSEASRLMPVIAVTAGCSEDVCVRAFESGADDCIARPVPPRELGARIRNLLRRAGTAEDDRGDLAIAVSAMRVRDGETTHALSRGEAEILALLVEAHGVPLTVERILERLPPEHRVKRGTVASRIKSLRRKVGGEKIVSRGRFGYSLADE